MSLIKRLFRSRHIHDDVGSWFKKYLRDGLVLDLPAGDGVNSRSLVASGFDVIAGDLFPENIHGKGIKIQKINLEKSLPFDDEKFDGILFSEGIEHLDAQVASLRDMARTLKPGGLLVVTTPNTLHLEGRLSLLLTGSARRNSIPVVATASCGNDTVNQDHDSEGVYFGHIFLINAFQLRCYLEYVGLEVVAVDTTRYSINSLLLAPFLYPLAWISTRRVLYRKKKKELSKEAAKTIMRQVLSPQLLFGKKLIMLARKPDKTQ